MVMTISLVTVKADPQLTHWMSCLDTDGSVCIIFVDFRKKFDLVNHNILYNKLKKSTAYPTFYYHGLVPIYQIANRVSLLTNLYLFGRNLVETCPRLMAQPTVILGAH